MTPLLEISELHTEIRLRHATVHALDGISLTVEAGECVGLVGESGCGKTLTALSIMHLLPPGGHITGGRILLEGTDIATLSDDAMRRVRGSQIGMIFQDPMTSLNPTMAIGDQIAEMMLLHRNMGRKARLARTIEILDMVGMPRPSERVRSYPHQLSGGMRQRAMIAMALACNPKLLIADEPTTALDVTIQKQILDLIDHLRELLGMAVILVTHDLGVIAGRADRAVIMYAGKVLETASTLHLYANPQHPYTEALFEAMPERVVDANDRLYSVPGTPPELTSLPTGCRFAPRCRYAQSRCWETEPKLKGHGAGHLFRCFFPVGEANDDAMVDLLRVAERTPVNHTPREVANRTRPLLQVEHLEKSFGVTSGALLQRKAGNVSAVADVSFSIVSGEVFGLVGESGCGKTTVGRLIAGLEKANGGSIVLNGEDLVKLTSRRRWRRNAKVQIMFQDSYASMDPRMRAGAILREPLEIRGVGTRRERQDMISAILEKVGLSPAATERFPHEFSGGQRQRLALARALILDPELLIADEPVSALDVSIQAQNLNLMQDLQRDLGLACLFISHDLSVVRYMSNTIGVMYLGKLVEVGPANSVYYKPAHPYSKGLIDTIPSANPLEAKLEEVKGVTGELPSAMDPPSGCRFRTRCPFAQEVCAQVEPQLRPFSADGHLAACHFPLWKPDFIPTSSIGTS